MKVYEEQLESTQVSIKSLDDFYHQYEQIVEQHQRENKPIELEILERLARNLSDELKKEVCDSIDITDENYKTLMKMYIEFTEFEKMDEQEKLHSISTDGSILDDICSLLYGENEFYQHEFCAKVLSSLYRNEQSFDEKDSFDVLYLFKGVAKYVLENDIDFETLKVDCTIFEDDRVARLSSLSQDGTYEHLASIHQEDDDFRKLRLANEDDREYIKDWFNGISEDEPIEIDDDERLAFAQTNEGTQTLLGLDDGNYEDAKKVISIDSIREKEQKSITPEIIEKWKKIVTDKPFSLGEAPSIIQNNKEIIICAINSNYHIYDNLPIEQQKDKDIFYATLSRLGKIYTDLSKQPLSDYWSFDMRS